MSTLSDIWGWTDEASGREFALLGLSDGTAFVEITDPGNPVYLGKLDTHTTNSSWRDIKTYQNHAFIVAEASNHGLQVFDLTQLLASSGSPVSFSASAHYSGFGNSHNIAINEASGFAYAVGTNTCSGGLHMIDISVPQSPVFAGCFSGDGYTHDVHCVTYDGPDQAFVGRQVCVASNEDTVTIVDVTNKSSPTQLSRTSYAQTGYTHQGWLTEDHRYFIFGDETDESSLGINTKTLVFDVTSLSSPVMAGAYYNPTTRAIDHNQYVKGDYVYQANYRAGLRVLRMDDMSTPSFSEVGYFDIDPGSNAVGFNGAWSVFPYFASGVVVVSGIEQGLFVLNPEAAVNPASPTSSPTKEPTRAPTPTPTSLANEYHCQLCNISC